MSIKTLDELIEYIEEAEADTRRRVGRLMACGYGECLEKARELKAHLDAQATPELTGYERAFARMDAKAKAELFAWSREEEASE